MEVFTIHSSYSYNQSTHHYLLFLLKHIIQYWSLSWSPLSLFIITHVMIVVIRNTKMNKLHDNILIQLITPNFFWHLNQWYFPCNICYHVEWHLIKNRSKHIISYPKFPHKHIHELFPLLHWILHFDKHMEKNHNMTCIKPPDFSSLSCILQQQWWSFLNWRDFPCWCSGRGLKNSQTYATTVCALRKNPN